MARKAQRLDHSRVRGLVRFIPTRFASAIVTIAGTSAREEQRAKDAAATRSRHFVFGETTDDEKP